MPDCPLYMTLISFKVVLLSLLGRLFDIQNVRKNLQNTSKTCSQLLYLNNIAKYHKSIFSFFCIIRWLVTHLLTYTVKQKKAFFRILKHAKTFKIHFRCNYHRNAKDLFFSPFNS